MVDLDFTKREEPAANADQRAQLTEWLEYQRHEFQRKLRDLTPHQLAQWAVPPVELSVLGLVRHMQQMEHVYLSWGLGGGDQELAYGDDDYAGGSADTVEEDLERYLAEVAIADEAMASMPDLDAPGAGHGRPLGWSLLKMLDEYALHSGQAHMLRFAALAEIIR